MTEPSRFGSQIRDTRTSVARLSVADAARFAKVNASDILEVEENAESLPVELVAKVAKVVGLRLQLVPIAPAEQSRLTEADLDF